eukprot:c39938_g1_i1 orf=175-669(+)
MSFPRVFCQSPGRVSPDPASDAETTLLPTPPRVPLCPILDNAHNSNSYGTSEKVPSMLIGKLEASNERNDFSAKDKLHENVISTVPSTPEKCVLPSVEMLPEPASGWRQYINREDSQGASRCPRRPSTPFRLLPVDGRTMEPNATPTSSNRQLNSSLEAFQANN